MINRSNRLKGYIKGYEDHFFVTICMACHSSARYFLLGLNVVCNPCDDKKKGWIHSASSELTSLRPVRLLKLFDNATSFRSGEDADTLTPLPALEVFIHDYTRKRTIFTGFNTLSICSST